MCRSGASLCTKGTASPTLDKASCSCCKESFEAHVAVAAVSSARCSKAFLSDAAAKRSCCEPRLRAFLSLVFVEIQFVHF